MPPNRKITLAFYLLLVASALMRGFIAGFIELGNDEVYYWTYAKFPALSHFDHPPMVGLVIQLFSLNLYLDSEFFIRLASVVLGTLSTALMFLLGRAIRNPLTGLYAALMFTASFYGFILCGTFILPDSPQVFFWLLTLYLLVRALPDPAMAPRSRRLLLLAGVSAGLALLSKYHAIFLLTGVFSYLLLYDRKWFKATETYGALLIALLFTIPVVIWNVQYDFISFTFHESRVSITEAGIQTKYLLTELAGQFFYNNPVNVVIILVALFALIRGKNFLAADYRRIILWISVPLVLVFMSFSLFRSTLPHWTGPGYLGFILVAAAYLSSRAERAKRIRLVPLPLVFSLLFMLLVIGSAVTQVRYGWVPLSRWKMDDVSHDLAGWRQLGAKFAQVAGSDGKRSVIQKNAPIFTFRWFPAANLDYYAASVNGRPVYVLGTLERIHKYYWINKIHGNLAKGSDAYYLGLSDDFQDPAGMYGSLFDTILPPDTLFITRKYDTVRKVYLYRMLGLKEAMIFNK